VTVIFTFYFDETIVLAGIGSADLLGALWTYYAQKK
jgi:hypothetical protein